MPGLGSPMALRSPQSVWTTVGLGYPVRGSFPIDLVTMAPAPASITVFMDSPV